jgi:hypothetical protein
LLVEILLYILTYIIIDIVNKIDLAIFKL